MASTERLLKSLESLIFSENTSKKKEIRTQCLLVTEVLTSSTAKNLPNLTLVLTVAIETFLKLCDHPDSNLRMLANECLNRTIKALSPSHNNRMLVQLLQEINRNGNARSLRAALSRFAMLCSTVKIDKRKPSVDILIPGLRKIAEREDHDDMVAETLAEALDKIMQAWGKLIGDSDVKGLIKSFLGKLSSQSAVTRRAAANSILTICKYSKQSKLNTMFVFCALIDQIIPIRLDITDQYLLGILNCLRNLIDQTDFEQFDTIRNPFNKSNKPEMKLVDFQLQVYELSMYYLSHNNHNVVNACLEVLDVLLKNPTKEFVTAISNPDGVRGSRIDLEKLTRTKSLSEISESTTYQEIDRLALERELCRPDSVSNWVKSVKLAQTVDERSFDETESVMNESIVSFDRLSLNNYLDEDHGESYSMKGDSFGCEEPFGDLAKMSDNASDLSELNDHSFLYPEIHSGLNSPKLGSSLRSSILNFNESIDIGNFTDKQISLHYCARLICKSFLLNGEPRSLTPDKRVRVTTKSLAINLLTSIVNVKPDTIWICLDRSKNIESGQQISDIFLYENHEDPQLRGGVRILIGLLIHSIHSFKNDCKLEISQLKRMLDILATGLNDESSTTICQTLTALKTCMNDLLESHSALFVPILKLIPNLASKPYWLVKVKLIEFVQKLPYVTISYACEEDFQASVLNRILFSLLADDDARVRTCAANGIVTIIPLLFFAKQAGQSAIFVKTTQLRLGCLNDLFVINEDMSFNSRDLSPVISFDEGNVKNKASVECSLFRMLTGIERLLLGASKNLMFGCIETISSLTSSYSPIFFKNAYIQPIFDKPNQTACLLSTFINLMSISESTIDLTCQKWLITTCGNLFPALCIQAFKPTENFTVDFTQNGQSLWNSLNDDNLKVQAEEFLVHVMKVLNIYAFVLEDIVPSMSKTILPGIGNVTSSPKRKAKSDTLDRIRLTSPVKTIMDKDERMDRRLIQKLGNYGNFANDPHYMKLYNVVKLAHGNYKVALDDKACENFTSLLQANLIALSQILEVCTIQEIVRIVEEILTCLQFCFNVAPAYCTLTTRQLLKCLFSTNFYFKNNNKLHSYEPTNQSSASIYQNLFQHAHKQFTGFVGELNYDQAITNKPSNVMNYETFWNSSVDGPYKKTLETYIKMFKPMVLKSLSQYNMSDENFQRYVLELITELLRLKINYCMLDPQQIFFQIVLEHFKHIEDNQIANPERLTSNIFYFLVHLTYDKLHSKPILTVPEIINYCDRLIASGQSPLTHAIPAIKPIVYDIFFLRERTNNSTMDGNELETTKDFLFSIMLRLIEYGEVLDIFKLILHEYQVDDDKLSRATRTILDTLLPLLSQSQVRLETNRGQMSMNSLLAQLCPNEVFKSIHLMLAVWFQYPPTKDSNMVAFKRWIGSVLTVFLIATQINEDVLLSELVEFKSKNFLSIFSPIMTKPAVKVVYDPLLCVSVVEKTPLKSKTKFGEKKDVDVTDAVVDDEWSEMQPEVIFARLIFHVIGLSSEKCLGLYLNDLNDDDEYFIEQTCGLLMYCIHLLQSGSHRRTLKAAVGIIASNDKKLFDVEKINENFMKLAPICPVLSYEWSYILILIGYNDVKYWSLMCGGQCERPVLGNNSKNMNSEIVRRSSIMLFSDYLSDNITDYENLTWFLNNHTEIIIEISHESPVEELVSAVHRNSQASSIFLHAIRSLDIHRNKPLFLSRLLKCLQNVHIHLSHVLLELIVSHLLYGPYMSLSRQAITLANRRLEHLLTLPVEDVIMHFDKGTLTNIVKAVVRNNLIEPYPQFVFVLNKFATKYYNLAVIESTNNRKLNPIKIRETAIDKQWYVAQVKFQCCHNCHAMECARLLAELNWTDAVEIMKLDAFNPNILIDCLTIARKNDDLSKSVANVLFGKIVTVCKEFPDVQEVFEPFGRDVTDAEESYANTFKIIAQHNGPKTVEIARVCAVYCRNWDIPNKITLEFVNFAKFAIELTALMITNEKFEENIDPIKIETLLSCAKNILEKHFAVKILNENVVWFASAVNSLFVVVKYLLKIPNSMELTVNQSQLTTPMSPIMHSCHQLVKMLDWLRGNNSIFELETLKIAQKLAVSFCKLDLVNSFVLTPSILWQSNWDVKLTGPFGTIIPGIPIEFLREVDVLEEFIHRTIHIGYSNRKQFEESWMCFLTVFNNNFDDTSDEETIAKVNCLVVQALTTLLINSQRMLNGSSSAKFLYIPRGFGNLGVECQKLRSIQNVIHDEFRSLMPYFTRETANFLNVKNRGNLEKSNKLHEYTHNQVCVEFLRSRCVLPIDRKMSEYFFSCQNESICWKRDGLDVDSCVKFILDLYSQCLKNEVPLRLRHEIVKSIVSISDLFIERSQHQWMFDTFSELSGKYPAVDDELIHQYLVLGMCKAAAVLSMNLEVYQQLKTLLEIQLRSSLQSSRILAQHSLLYILESLNRPNLKFGGLSEKVALFQNLVNEYLQDVLFAEKTHLVTSDETILIWTIAFYDIECFYPPINDTDELPETLHYALNYLTNANLNETILILIIQGIDRLIVNKKVGLDGVDVFLKSSIELLKNSNPNVAFVGLQLLQACMYTTQQAAKPTDDSEYLMMVIENFTEIFNRIKRGYPFEAEIFCGVLSRMLCDFLPPSDMLTKVIGEFLSPQQPYPKLLSGVVFELFKQASQESQLDLLQDWVVSTLPNFTQSCFPVEMATWYLTCFFISASTNDWLRALYAHFKSRMGKYEYEDRLMLCVSAVDFYKSLEERQRTQFLQTFKAVQDRDLFKDLLEAVENKV